MCGERGAGTYKGCEVHGAWCERAAANNYAQAVAHLLYRATPSYPAQGSQQVDRKNMYIFICRVPLAGSSLPNNAEVISRVVMEFLGEDTHLAHHAHAADWCWKGAALRNPLPAALNSACL